MGKLLLAIGLLCFLMTGCSKDPSYVVKTTKGEFNCGYFIRGECFNPEANGLIGARLQYRVPGEIISVKEVTRDDK